MYAGSGPKCHAPIEGATQKYIASHSLLVSIQNGVNMPAIEI